MDGQQVVSPRGPDGFEQYDISERSGDFPETHLILQWEFGERGEPNYFRRKRPLSIII